MLDVDPILRDLHRRRHGTPVVDCPRCPLTFIGAGAYQAYADHSWEHLRETLDTTPKVCV